MDATGATWELLQLGHWSTDSSAMVTCDGNAACCIGLVVSSTGGVSDLYADMLGTYIQDFDASSDHPAYTKDGYTMFYLKDVLHHFEGWTISDSMTDIGPITNEGEAACIEKADSNWEYLDAANSEWKTDVTLSFECVEVAQCCDMVTLSSSGSGQERFPDMMGSYQNTGTYENGRPVFTHTDDASVQLK